MLTIRKDVYYAANEEIPTAHTIGIHTTDWKKLRPPFFAKGGLRFIRLSVAKI